MNPSYGIILWIVIGAIAGWLGSIIMGTNARQGALMNIVVGVLGASLGGFLTRVLFGDNPGILRLAELLDDGGGASWDGAQDRS